MDRGCRFSGFGISDGSLLSGGTATALLFLLALPLLFTGCGDRRDDRPNILFVVWDTVRADRLGVYGCDQPTTPFVDRWAKGARVFEDCKSVANCTVPAHASWFTGLLPGEHGRNNNSNHLDDRFDTLAELLKRSGYRTYMFSANPHIVRQNNFSQGFGLAEHPWDRKYLEEATRNRSAKLTRGESGRPRLPASRRGKPSPWEIKDGGRLARKGLLDWVRKSNNEKPYFAFINYMEAHLPCTPAAPYLERMAGGPESARETGNGISWADLWCYTFGQKELSEARLARGRLKYAACVAELDALFEDLLSSLEKAGCLENTVVILTADHGEHLGEHHLLDHQYSLYEPLIRVPLLACGPGLLEPGREARPVTNCDIFPTLLEVAGINCPEEIGDKAKSLLHPEEERIRVAELPAFPTHWFSLVSKKYAGFDPRPFARTLRAAYKGKFKLIASSDGRHELYDLSADPDEADNLAAARPELLERMRKVLDEWVASFDKVSFGPGPHRKMSEEARRRFEELGY
jgi:arylsulfatase A-like enzyme